MPSSASCPLLSSTFLPFTTLFRSTATFFQGVTLGAFIDGVHVVDGRFAGGALDWLQPFPMFTGASLVVAYAMLGSTWLIMKTEGELDRKSTRLNSSHLVISYAIFCFLSSLVVYVSALHDALPIYRDVFPGRHARRFHRRRARGRRSIRRRCARLAATVPDVHRCKPRRRLRDARQHLAHHENRRRIRSEEHTSELQSPCNLVCHLLLLVLSCRLRFCPSRRSSDLPRRFSRASRSALSSTACTWSTVDSPAVRSTGCNRSRCSPVQASSSLTRCSAAPGSS